MEEKGGGHTRDSGVNELRFPSQRSRRAVAGEVQQRIVAATGKDKMSFLKLEIMCTSCLLQCRRIVAVLELLAYRERGGELGLAWRG